MTRRILIFSRPFIKQFDGLYQKSAKKIGKEVTIISDFPNYGVNINNFNVNVSDNSIIDNKIKIEHIQRCRFLRSIHLSKAYNLLKIAEQKLNAIIQYYNPKCVISVPIDNYISYLLYELCKSYRIKFLAPHRSSLGDYTRVNSCGEFIKVRNVNDEEVLKIYENLKDDKWKPYSLNKSRNNYKLISIYLKEKLKKLHFNMSKIYYKDQDIFHYNTIYPTNYCLTCANISYIKPRNYFLNISQSKKLLKTDFIFFPIQFSPETSLDYHINDFKFSFYESLILRIIEKNKTSCRLVTKEHPSCLGYRNPEFYKFLKDNNVDILHDHIPIDNIILKARGIIFTGGATTGIEAIAKKVPFMNLGGSFYLDFVDSINKFDFDDYTMSDFIVPDEPYAHKTLKKALENTLSGKYDFFNRSKNSINNNDIKIVDQILNLIVN
jgi:hypothetical protein